MGGDVPGSALRGGGVPGSARGEGGSQVLP